MIQYPPAFIRRATLSRLVKTCANKARWNAIEQAGIVVDKSSKVVGFYDAAITQPLQTPYFRTRFSFTRTIEMPTLAKCGRLLALLSKECRTIVPACLTLICGVMFEWIAADHAVGKHSLIIQGARR